MSLHHTQIALSLVVALSACSAAQQPAHSTIAKGETVKELGNNLWYVFQARNNDYWFGSNGDGVYRFDGKTITHFTTKDGLLGNTVRGIQEDKSGNIYFTTIQEVFTPPDPKPAYPAGISRFDGKAFRTLPLPGSTSPDSAWKLEPDDLWFAGGQDSGEVYRWDGETLHRLKMPKTKIGEEHIAKHPRLKFPNARFSPYDVYTIFKDSKGSVWFGTGNLGALRFDGKSLAWIAEDEFTWLNDGAMFALRSIIEDKDGKFWFTNTLHRYDVYRGGSASQAKGVISYKKEKGIDNGTDDDDYFMSAIKDKNGDLWMSTYGAGVWRYDGKNMTHYPVMAGNTPITVFAIYKDNRGDLWLGTHERGVYKFNGKTFEKFRP
jgi:ligand-binding sensor domain-containing protein